MPLVSIPWTPGLGLRCPACGYAGPPTTDPDGCPACGAPLETTYEPGSTWRLPLPVEHLTDLGRVGTPLVRLHDDEPTWLKLESRNPTGSHKDRFHAISTAIAGAAGAPGVFTTSTGNHGVSCAAHAARAGIGSVVFASTELRHPLAVQLAAHGAVIGRFDDAGMRDAMRALVARGWFPATSSDPRLTGAATPYGTDGYRLVVDEIVTALGRAPDVVAVPCASGDTLVGLRRGLDDVAARLGVAPLTLLACEAEGADALARSVAAGGAVDLVDPRSIARSTVDTSVGRLAIEAASRDGGPVVVSDEAIVAATRALAAKGFYAETSSALALAGIRQARDQGRIEPDVTAVAIITAHGRGWSELEPDLFDVRFADDLDAILRAISS